LGLIDSQNEIFVNYSLVINTKHLFQSRGRLIKCYLSKIVIIQKNNKSYLITNLHVVTGVDFYSKATFDSQQRIPNGMGIWHNNIKLGTWTFIPETLYDRYGKKRWIECSYQGKTLDLVALPLQNLPDTIKIYPLDTTHYFRDLFILPGFPVSIIGFPNGLSSDGRLAIWKTGHIASDLAVDINGTPQFLIDATTRAGMSGSIVIFRMSPYLRKNLGTFMGIGTQFLGIYTSQSDLEEIGYVLKPIALKTLMDQLQ